MRFAILAIVAAGLASGPAVAQETNQANGVSPTTVVTGPDTALNNVAQPALPVTDGTAGTAAGQPATVQAPPGGEVVEQPTLQPDTRDDGGFPWGLLGLLGLLGLFGRVRT